MTRNHQQGFTLIEALIALVVLTMGLLGVAAMQITAIRNTQGSYARSQATSIMNDLAERIYANTPGASSYGGYDSSAAAGCAAGAPATVCETVSASSALACTPAQMAASDLYVTGCGASGAKTILPVGSLQADCLNTASGVVATCGAGSRIRITVNWTERGTVVEGASAGAMESANLAPQSLNLVIQP